MEGLRAFIETSLLIDDDDDEFYKHFKEAGLFY
jgi:hypothetical protein